jgi:hypothetical protein
VHDHLASAQERRGVHEALLDAEYQ